ncbi:MAG: hypothetical protein ACJ8GW_19065 [Massilia sp.]
MPLTLRQRSFSAATLVAIPWIELGIVQFTHPIQLHENAGAFLWDVMRLSLLAGGVFCIIALVLFFSSLVQRQRSLLLSLAAIGGAWFLVQWVPALAEGLLRSYHLIH